MIILNLQLGTIILLLFIIGAIIELLMWVYKECKLEAERRREIENRRRMWEQLHRSVTKEYYDNFNKEGEAEEVVIDYGPITD